MPGRFRHLLKRLLDCKGGAALIEFAFAAPILILVYVSTFVLNDEISCSRKVTVTARTLADLTTRYATMSTTNLATIMASSTQVLQPYNAAHASVRVSELLVTSSTTATVVWSSSYRSSGTTTLTALSAGASVTIPSSMAVTGTYLILGEISYAYTPALGLGAQTAMTIYDKSYMSPRLSNAIPLS